MAVTCSDAPEKRLVCRQRMRMWRAQLEWGEAVSGAGVWERARLAKGVLARWARW